MGQDLDIGMFYVYRWITRYESHLSEKLRNAVMVQQTVLNEAQSEYDHIFSLGHIRKVVEKVSCKFVRLHHAKGLI